MSKLPEDLWRPVGIDWMEPEAWRALKSDFHSSVVAGPGSGKSELLAQRASFLLQTGACLSPHQILAISFKRDAAGNLRERVSERCTPEEVSRFTSVTFDSFTKDIVDRFHMLLPEYTKISDGYEIDFLKDWKVEEFLKNVARDAPPHWQREIEEFDPKRFESDHVGALRLPAARPRPANARAFAVLRYWRMHYYELATVPVLNFTLINRLAELVIRHAAAIQRAAAATFSHIFVDEFQDTNTAQYDFLLSVFKANRGPTLTVVGDDKQRIMGYAGAIPRIFDRFAVDFGPQKFRLQVNFRSTSALVDLQHVVAIALDSDSAAVEGKQEPKLADGSALSWTFPNSRVEADHIAAWIVADIMDRRTRPSDYAILVRVFADRFEGRLRRALTSVGLKLRNDSRKINDLPLQEVRSDRLYKLLVALLKLSSASADIDSWSLACSELDNVRGRDSRADTTRKSQRELAAFVEKLKSTTSAISNLPARSRSCLKASVEFLGISPIANSYDRGPNSSEAETREFLNIVNSYFKECATEADDWESFIDAIEGVDSVALLTIHKSKGLEYDTAIIIGIDNENWFKRDPGDVEGISAFFVALSRARQRVVFTSSGTASNRSNVTDLWNLLETAGVPLSSIES